ncbi:MAG: aminotransferase class III-fold pyridoxal phosphate-dependent enzyme, partial [Bacteroidota bacterium]
MQEIENYVDAAREFTLFSWTAQGGLNPLHIDRADGPYLYDTDGLRYIDFSSQLMNVNVGHGRTRIAELVTQQMAGISYLYPGGVTSVRGRVGAMLASITPGRLKK